MKQMKVSIDDNDLQKILDSTEHKEIIHFAGEVKEDTLHVQEITSNRSVFWPLSRCLNGKSTGYVKYTKEGIILCGADNKIPYEIKIS